jgi:hypothetical protein
MSSFPFDARKRRIRKRTILELDSSSGREPLGPLGALGRLGLLVVIVFGFAITAQLLAGALK